MTERHLVVFSNSHAFFHQHKQALFEQLPDDVALTLHTGEFDPAIASNFPGGIVPLTINRYAHIGFGDFAALRSMIGVLRHQHPDITIALTLKVALFLALAGSTNQLTGAPPSKVVFFFSGLGRVFGSRKRSVFHRLRLSSSITLLRSFARRNRCKFVFENVIDQRLFVALGIADFDNSKVINGTGVPVDVHISPKPTDGPLRVVFAGRMLRSKGIEILIDAFYALDAAEDIELDVFGASHPHDRDGFQLDTLNLPSRIRYHGAVPITKVGKALAASHCVCLPTLYREGLPRILLEGAAHGCALISTDMPGCGAIVKDGKTGRLIRSRQPKAIKNELIDSLKAMASDRGSVIEMGRNARAEILDGEFSEKAVREAFQRFVLG